jgi:hypothetical protein
MYQKKNIYFFDNLQKTEIADKKIALEIEEISHYNLKIQFLNYYNNGEIAEKNNVGLDCLVDGKFTGENFRIELLFEPKPEVNKRYLRVYFEAPNLKNTTLIDISNVDVRKIAQIVYSLLIFCKKNSYFIKNYGFRKELNSNFIFLKYKKKEFLEDVLNIRTYLLQTSQNRVGKDNVFKDYLIIQYNKNHNIYFLNLIYNFLGCKGHNKEEMTFKKCLGEERAWSPSFPDRIVENHFQSTRIELIQYIIDNYNNEEALRMNLLNINF